MDSTISKIISVAQSLAPILASSAQAVTTGKAVIDLIDDAKETIAATPEQVERLEEERSALEQAVLAHADATAASLGDG